MQARKRTRHRANGCALVLRVAEPELARDPRTPGAERQGSSAQARRLHELRSEVQFTSLAKKIRMTLAVIPQMRLRKHGSLPSTSRTRSRAVVFLTVPSAVTPLVNQDEVLSCELMAASDALERPKDGLRCFSSIFVRLPTPARETGARIFRAFTRAGHLPRRRGVRRPDRERAGALGATHARRWASGIRNSPPPFRKRMIRGRSRNAQRRVDFFPRRSTCEPTEGVDAHPLGTG